MDEPQAESPFEDNMLHGEIVMDAWLMLHSRLTPEQLIDLELTQLKKNMLEAFYRRFPGQQTETINAEG
jgi:hypothetical protein